jgi:hypothetical protein
MSFGSGRASGAVLCSKRPQRAIAGGCPRGIVSRRDANMNATSFDDPEKRRARPVLQPGRAGFTIDPVSPSDPALNLALREWDWMARGLLARGAVSAQTRPNLEDSRRIVGELGRVLAGDEPGEGIQEHRSVFVARRIGCIQAAAALFASPRAVFVELVATAPWNLLGAADPPDARMVRGAGTALLQHASAWSLATGGGGRVSLQAENPRCRAYYEWLGFERMTAADEPYTLVPRGPRGFSEPVRRVAEGREGPDEQRSPWMLFDPARPASVADRPRGSSERSPDAVHHRGDARRSSAR